MPKLPDETQLKMQQLIELEQQAQFAVSSTMKQISEINQALAMSPDKERLTSLQRELAFQQNSLSRHQIKNKELSALNAHLRRYLERLPADCVIVPAKNLEIKFLPEEDNLAAVDRVRGEIASILFEKLKIERADIALEEKKALVSDWIARQSDRGAPHIRFENGGPIVKFDARVENAFAPTSDLGAMLTWLHPKTMEKRLHSLLEDAPQPAFSLSSERKADALKTLAKSLLAAERREEQLIMAAADRNQQIARRPNTDPQAVLQIAIRSAEAKIARRKKTAA